MRNFFLFLFFLSVTINLYSQDIKIKKDVVYDAGKAILKVEGTETKGFTFYTMNGEELIYMVLNPYKGSNTWKYTFIKDNKVMFPTNLYYRKTFVEALVKNGLLVDGVWNAEKLNTFILKYQQIE
jgi:hypothetical protein